MHTYHVTLKSQRKEKPDLQPSMQRLFYMKKSSRTQFLFSLIKTKQREEKGRVILHVNWHSHWKNIECRLSPPRQK